ncbi:MAG: BMP family ABC transporter substrate-binding protein [Anaerolineae bacterium]|nr:BMP family ABC transporter substrate-binding protein [Anaerolineae bacterium]MCX8066868.1 BMP family ABC transporter substrate-binding protein [Anaerolineae bacterium]
MQERFRVGFVTDGGRIDDGSFNQYAYEGTLQAAQEYGLRVELLETSSPAEYEANIRQAIERGCNLVVTVGSTTGATVERLAARYPKVHFILVDYEPMEESRNVTGLVFAEDQAGFLAGALAGLMTEREVVGFVGGVDVPPVRKFRLGFEHGVAYTNRRAKVLTVYTHSFTDERKGEEAARQLIEQGADVLFAAAGGCGSAAIRAAAALGAWVVGSDQDHWETTFQKGTGPGADRLLTSAVKRVDRAVREAISLAVAGKLHGGVLRFDLHNDGIGLAPYHAADVAVPSEVRGKVREIAEGLRTGRIRTQVGPRGEDLERRLWARIRAWNWQSVAMIFLAIFTALVVGAIFIAAFDPQVWAAFGQGIGAGLVAAGASVVKAYSAFFEGAFGNPARILAGLQIWLNTGDSARLLRAIYPLTESLRLATPYIFAGLAVALGFRCGLFNIGAEGQYFIGGLTSVFVGYAVTGLPWFIHLPLALAAGWLGGALWASIAGILKARTGAHEVITTIMLNYISYRLADYLLQVGGPMSRPGDSRPVSPEILPTAYLPQFFPNDPSIRLNAGLLLALVAVWFVYWLLFKTTVGFEIRAVGANPRAARTAGISVARNIVLAMFLSGGLAGLAGAHDILGVLRFMPNAFFSGYGFDSIALALLGKSHPVGVLLAALLFGFLRAGAQRMQGVAHVPIDIISILQALIIIFIAAPEIIRFIYRIRAPKETAELVFTRGWGRV